MRTTLVIDDDILDVARAIADAESRSIGSVVSELARKGYTGKADTTQRNGFTMFNVDGPTINPDFRELEVAEDEERYGNQIS